MAQAIDRNRAAGLTARDATALAIGRTSLLSNQACQNLMGKGLLGSGGDAEHQRMQERTKFIAEAEAQARNGELDVQAVLQQYANGVGEKFQ